MFSKIAFKNTLRSIRDYAVYFFTMTLGVCLFYMFNSIGDQQAMLVLSESQKKNVQQLTEMLGYISVFVSFILGFLILYANRFLIRRRKKEMGIYLTLGMSRFRVSAMLIAETFLIGIFSLAVGITLGIFGAQALSVFTARMFQANLSGFYFIFSKEACLKTILYFGVIFLVIMAFNTISVSRLRLIDLIYADRQNENFRVKRLWISVVVFLVSVCCLGIAYAIVLKNGMFHETLLLAIILGIIGTLFFFFSLSGFLLRLMQAGKKHYYKNLNMFVLRQINARINTAFLSISVICLMLFVTICTLAGGMSISNLVATQNEMDMPYDISFVCYFGGGAKIPEDMAARMEKAGVPLKEYSKARSQVELLSTEISHAEMAKGILDVASIDPLFRPYFEEEGYFLRAVSLSDYNGAMKACGRSQMELAADEYSIISPVISHNSTMQELARQIVDKGKTITLGGKTYSPSAADISENSICNRDFSGTWILILPDETAETLVKDQRILNLMYKDGINEDEFLHKMDEALMENISPDDDASVFDMYTSRQQMIDNTVGVRVMVLYLALYIGIVFLIVSAAVLALQQLSDVSDSVGRYALLRKLGAEEAMVNRALISQTAIYFFIPLLLAVVHSVIGLTVVNREFGILYMGAQMLDGALFASLVFLLVYGGYFILACLGGRAMLRRGWRS
ncbi:MAG: FtsX-like permease family protein [Hydrogeniiclostridium sp.]